MKKYSSGSFIDAAVRVYGSEADTITSFPASIIANGGNITPWEVYGNTVEGVSVGNKTENLFDINSKKTIGGRFAYDCTLTIGQIYTFKNCSNHELGFKISVTATSYNSVIKLSLQPNESYTFTMARDPNIPEGTTQYFFIIVDGVYGTEVNDGDVMLNTGETALPYEPYGYNVIISCGDTDYNCYISDVLRKSTGADPVYDIMSSTGIITRNVDTDGTPLVTPTTESFTAPTIATVAGSQSLSFDTTVKPSKAELTYTGWHTHSDKKRSGGAWV